jgi:hypothetical protein
MLPVSYVGQGLPNGVQSSSRSLPYALEHPLELHKKEVSHRLLEGSGIEKTPQQDC